MKGLYIHIPFCVQKCKYCDFISYVGQECRIDEYLKQLYIEMQKYKCTKVDTIFIGGGTPSVLGAYQISELMRNVKNTFLLADNCEITMESNPGTLDEKKIHSMLESGINRVSVGVQSFNDAELKTIGRIHNAELAYNSICLLKSCGLTNINLDLMTALPFQTMDSLKNTLKTAVSLPITHISAYSLIIEDNTPLEREYSQGKLILPTEDEDREMYKFAVDYLAKNGFMRYEISNFAKQGFECRHNIKYWSCDEYIGIGAAAHSYIGDKRYSNPSGLSNYIGDEKGEEVVLEPNDKISEFMMMGLRMDRGINRSEFKKRFGVQIEEMFSKQLDKFVSLGLMKCDGENYSLTDRGFDISNSIMCEFMI